MSFRKLFDGRNHSGKLYRITARQAKRPIGKTKVIVRIEEIRTAKQHGGRIQ
jgi:hypothetical protein